MGYDLTEPVKAHCYLCGETDRKKFYKDKSRENGLSSRCKACNKEATKVLRAKKPAPFKAPAPDDLRRCSRCKVMKYVPDFYASTWRRSGVSSECRACYAVRAKNDAPTKRYKLIEEKYGLTKEAYFDLLENQGGVCAICKKPEISARFKFLSVDHCHKTNKIRGLLCHRCNKGLGQFGDDPTLLVQAIGYLGTNTCS